MTEKIEIFKKEKDFFKSKNAKKAFLKAKTLF